MNNTLHYVMISRTCWLFVVLHYSCLAAVSTSSVQSAFYNAVHSIIPIIMKLLGRYYCINIRIVCVRTSSMEPQDFNLKAHALSYKGWYVYIYLSAAQVGRKVNTYTVYSHTYTLTEYNLLSIMTGGNWLHIVMWQFPFVLLLFIRVSLGNKCSTKYNWHWGIATGFWLAIC